MNFRFLVVSGCAAWALLLGGCGDSGTTGSGGSTSSSTGAGSTTTTSSTMSSTGSTGTSTGATTTSSSTGGGMAQAECATASDCQLEDDCCACAGLPKTRMIPQCNQQCVQNQCAALGYMDTLDCQAGRCVAGFDCDWSTVACASPPPQCPAGQTASVMGLCYGPCVPADECASVTDCTQCATGQACVFYGGGIMKSHCVDTPPECNGTPTCACMGTSLCGSIPCGDDGMGHLTCQIP